MLRHTIMQRYQSITSIKEILRAKSIEKDIILPEKAEKSVFMKKRISDYQLDKDVKAVIDWTRPSMKGETMSYDAAKSFVIAFRLAVGVDEDGILADMLQQPMTGQDKIGNDSHDTNKSHKHTDKLDRTGSRIRDR